MNTESVQSYAYDPVEYVEKEKCFIVAGSLREFDEYVKKKRNQYAIMRQECPYDYFYVNGVDSLRGHTITKGFYIGSWRNRKDIEDIKQMVAINKSHGVIKNDPLKSARQATIEQAAEEFKKAIDAEVLKKMAEG